MKKTTISPLSTDNISSYSSATPTDTTAASGKGQSMTVSVRDFGGVGDGIVDDTEALQRAVDYLKQQKQTQSLGKAAPVSKIQSFQTLDLNSGHYLISSPIKLNSIFGCIIANGTVTASRDFPIDEYLFDFKAVNTAKVENILFECRKRANGIFAHKFFRLRIEDCTILHQKSFGIYGSRKGYNHELEVFKCSISEYLWGDGKPKGKDQKPEIPDFQDASNRESTGIFLGQADNVVADCNINLCKVGIKVGMRANRIQGNHITAGGTHSNEIYDGIVLDKHIKSSCLIVNNYIDNCRLKIYVNADRLCKRNYVTVTDNLFYRGFNHPKDKEFNHIVICPLERGSILQNIIISNNQFYTQDEHLDGQKKRVIKPIHVDDNTFTKGNTTVNPSVNPKQIIGAVVQGNNFTNVHPYYEIPMATRLTGIINEPEEPKDLFEFDFSEHVPWGEIQSRSVTMSTPDGESPVPFSVSKIEGCKLMIKTLSPVIARFDVSIDVNSYHHQYENSVITH